MDGYYAKEGRGGSGVTAFDYAPVKELPADKEPINAERQGYNRGLNLEHPRLLNYDLAHPQGITTWKQYPGGGGYAGEAYDIGYTHAMMQAIKSF